MNGRYLLDTNAVIALLGGDAGLVNLLQQALWVGILVMVELEFLSFSNLSTKDATLFTQFRNRVEVIGLEVYIPAAPAIQLRQAFLKTYPLSACSSPTMHQFGRRHSFENREKAAI